MKNLYPRLKKAPVDAPVTHRPGIYPNSSPCADTPTGYLVSKNQNSRKWKLLPKLAALLLLLQFFTASIKLNAQAPVVTNPWANLNPGPGSVGPRSIKVDANGNLYTANGSASTISKVTPSGAVTSSWASLAAFAQPYDISFDASGNLYSANYNHNTVSKITPTGVVTQAWATLATGAQPYAVATDANGNVYTANYGNSTVSKITPTGVVTQAWATFSANSRPSGIIVDISGNIYVANYGSRKVSKITPTGVLTEAWATLNPLAGPEKLVFDNNGNLYTSNSGNNTVSKITSAGVVTEAWATLTQQTTVFPPDGANPLGIAFDAASGSIFTANVLNNTISKISVSNGSTIQNWVTGLDAPSSLVTFQGNLYVANSYGGTITKILLPGAFNISFNQTSPTCSNSNDGGLKAIPSQTCGTGYQFLWTPGGATTDTISNLAPGTYSVRVVCGTDTVNKSVTLTATTVVAAPNGNDQIQCFGATINDLIASPITGYTLRWYSTATSGTALASSTLLIDSAKYYASQLSPANCESVARREIRVFIKGNITPSSDTVLCNSNTIVKIPIKVATGATNFWTATQNGTGVPASGSIPVANPILLFNPDQEISFTPQNHSTKIIKDTVYRSSDHTIPLAYGIQDSTYYFADTLGSTYLSPSVATQFPLGTGGARFTDSLTIGFPFNFYGTNYNKIYIGSKGRLAFDRTSIATFFSINKGIIGYSAFWDVDAQTKVAYKVAGTAPNRKFTVTYVNLKTPPDNLFNTFFSDPVAGRGTFQIVLSETSNKIEILHQLIPGVQFIASPQPLQPAWPVAQGIINGDSTMSTFVPERRNVSTSTWLKIENENKSFFPIQQAACATQRDTLVITALPTPLVNDVENVYQCPGQTVAAINFTTLITGGTVGYKWTNNNPTIGIGFSGFGNIPSFTISSTSNQTATIKVLPYLIKSGTDTCFGIERQFTISNTIPAPVHASASFCAGATIADLSPILLPGFTADWYAASTGGAPLPSNTVLVNGTQYFMSQKSASCESSTRGVYNATIRGALNTQADTLLCNTNTLVNLPLRGTTGATYNWTATQNGTGIGASGTTSPLSFTAQNNGNSPKTDTVTLSSNYIPHYNYGLKDSIYYYADTTGSTYLDPTSATTFPRPFSPFINALSKDLTDSIAIGFPFNYYGYTMNKILIGRAGVLVFNNQGFLPGNVPQAIYGYRAPWSFDAQSKVAYKVSGTAPNRKFIVTYIDLKRPDDNVSYKYASYPLSGRGNFQIVLNETTNTIEVLHKLIPSVSIIGAPLAWELGPYKTVSEAVFNTEFDFVRSSATLVPGRSGSNQSYWYQIENECKIFFPIAPVPCVTSRDTFAVSVLPTPKVDTIVNQQLCPGTVTSAINFTTPITGATVGYKWTNNNTAIGLAASGFGNIPSFTAAATAQTSTISVRPYLLKSATDTCFGTVRTFTINAIFPPAPTTANSLVVYTGIKTISQLDVTSLAGGALNFYYETTGGTALPGSTVVVDDTTYYISQIVAGCESNLRKAIKVNRIAADSIVLCSQATVANLTATPNTGNTAKWFTAGAGGSALASSTSIATGTYYVEEGNAGTTQTILTYSLLPNNATGAINSMTLIENDSIYFGMFDDTAKIVRAEPSGANQILISKGAANENVRYMQYETEGANQYILYTTQNFVKRRNLATGAVTTVWTSPTTPSFNLKQVSRDVANNKLYVADAENGRIKLVDLTNNTAITTDSLAKFPFGAGFFTARPFGVCYVAPNTLYYSDFERRRVYKKNIATGVLTDSVTLNSGPTAMYKLNDGRIMVTTNFNVFRLEAELTGQTTLATGTGAGITAAQFNANNELLFIDGRTIKKVTSVQSNRVPVTVIVNPIPNVIATVDKVICNNNAVTAINFSTATTGGTVTYAWTNNKTSIGLTANGNGNIASFTAVNNGTAPDTARIIVTPTITNAGVSCTGTKDTFLIIVNPTAKINAIADKVECNGSVVAATMPTSTATGGTVTYTWTNNTTSIGLAASGTGNIPSLTATNTGSTAITSTIIVTPTFTNGGVSCVGTNDTFNITINPPPIFVATADKYVCNASTTTPVVFSTALTGGTAVYHWTNSNTAIGLAATGTGNVPSFTATNTTTAPIMGSVVVYMDYTNAGLTCTSLKDTFSYVVNPTAVVNPINDQVLCNGAAVTTMSFSTTATGGTTTYAWTNDKPGIGLAATGTGNIAAFTAVNNSTAPDTATIIVTPTFANGGTSCQGTKDTIYIVVNPTANVNAINNQVVCNGAAVTAINFGTTNTGGTVTYAWTNNTTSIGLAASGTGNIPTFNGVNSGTTPVTATIVVTPTFTNGGVSCTGPTKTFTITINPTATVNAISNQVVCNGSAVTTVSFGTPATGGTTTYTWTNNMPSIGLPANGTGNIASFNGINTTTAPVTATITVTPTFTNGGTSCVGTARTYTITVNPTAKINAIADKVECNGSVVAATMPTSTATGGTVTYTWTNNTTSIGLAASGTGSIPSFTASNTNNSAVTATIIVTPTYTNGGISCVGTNDTFNITINPPPIFAATTDKYVCNGASTTPVLFTTALTGGTAVYHWTNNNTAIGLAASGTGNVPSFTATNNTTAPIMGSVVVYMDYTNAGLTCTSLKDTFNYVVNPTAVINPINDQVLCNGGTTTAITFSTTATGGDITYEWTNDKTGIGLATNGNGNIAAFTAINTGTAPDTAMIIVTPTFANGGISCEGIKDTIYIVVNPAANVNTISDQVVCNGTAVTAINFGTTNTGGTVTYAWTNNTTSIGLAASGNGNITSFNGVNTGTAPVVATITVTPTFSNGGVSCTGPSKTFTITVNPTVIVNTVANQVVCNGSAVSAVNFGTTATGGTVSFVWTNNTTSIGLAASGNGSIASFNGVNTGTAPVTATITVTPTFTNGGTSCIGTASTFTITINPTAKIVAISDKVECNGNVVAAITPSGTTTGGTVSYTWSNNNISIGLAANGTGTIPGFTATNTTNTAVTATIIVTPTYTNGGVSCVGTNDTFNITINPPPIFAATADKYVCNGASTTPVLFTTALTGGTAVYHWTNNNTAIGLAASGTGNVPTFTAINNTTAPIFGSIVVYMDYINAGLTCTSLKDTFNYVVNPTAVINPSNNQVLCNGGTTNAITFSTTATGGNTTYAWTNDKPGIGLAASGSGIIAAFTATNSSNVSVTATITVTPIFTNGGVSCNGTAQSFTVTVNPTAVVNAVSNQAVCADATNSGVIFNSPVAGTTYSWTNNNPSIGLAASGSGNVPSFVAVNPSPNAIHATITVTPNTPAGCIGQAITYTITVNGKSVAPTSINNPVPIVCANNAFATLSVNGGVLGSGAIWKWYADSLNTVSIGSGATLSNIPVAKTTTYLVRAEGTCNNTATASVVVQRANLVHHVRQHWSDVLLFDNSSRNFVAWQWYKNGVPVNGATLQQYSEGSPLVGVYHVVATDRNGIQSISCPLTITATSFIGLRISLYPNPVGTSANVTVATSFTASELQGANIIISDIYGTVINQISQVSPSIVIRAPATIGMYVVTLTLQNGMKYSANLLTK